jgi:hypothetical protein
MRKFIFVGLLGLSAAFWSASCQGPDELYRNGISVTGAGGTISPSGGGGTTGVAGTTGKAGTTGAGGATGRAGTSGSAGSSGNAGINGSAGTNGRAGTNGAAGMFGAAGTNGAAGTFGAAGTNGSAGTSGGTAGTTGTTGGAGTNGAANCIDAIKLSGYSATGAQPCSMCKNNQTDESAKCEKTIDCEDAAYPCDSNCKLNCQNSQGDDSVVTGCVNSLLTAASCS